MQLSSNASAVLDVDEAIVAEQSRDSDYKDCDWYD